MDKERKTEKLLLRLTPTDKKNISYHANLMNVSVTEYISLCIRRKRIVICEDFPDLIYHLSKIGTNINQIATIANTNQYISITNVEEVKQLMQKCYTELNNFIAFVAEPEKDYLQNDTEKISELLSQLTDVSKETGEKLCYKVVSSEQFAELKEKLTMENVAAFRKSADKFNLSYVDNNLTRHNVKRASEAISKYWSE